MFQGEGFQFCIKVRLIILYTDLVVRPSQSQLAVSIAEAAFAFRKVCEDTDSVLKTKLFWILFFKFDFKAASCQPV